MSRLLHPMLVAAPVAWLSERGELPEAFDASVLSSDGVPVDTQRRLLSRVVEVGGETALLELGERMLLARDEPLLYVMLNSSSVADFIDKEQRFNRYFHSDHRVRVHESRDYFLELEHVGPAIGLGYSYTFDSGLELSTAWSGWVIGQPRVDVDIDSESPLSADDEASLRHTIADGFGSTITNKYHVFQIGAGYVFGGGK